MPPWRRGRLRLLGAMLLNKQSSSLARRTDVVRVPQHVTSPRSVLVRAASCKPLLPPVLVQLLPLRRLVQYKYGTTHFAAPKRLVHTVRRPLGGSCDNVQWHAAELPPLRLSCQLVLTVSLQFHLQRGVTTALSIVHFEEAARLFDAAGWQHRRTRENRTEGRQGGNDNRGCPN